MGLVVSVYSRVAFKEYILPSVNNADYEINLRGDYFQIQRDMSLDLEILNGEWYLKEKIDYRIIYGDRNVKRVKLSDKLLLRLNTMYGEEIIVIIKEVKSTFHVYKKYLLYNIQDVRIGNFEEEYLNDIVYDFGRTVSKEHAHIKRQGNDFIIENHSPNGTYVDSVKIQGSKKLEFGNYINIMGLHMVFLGDKLAIDTMVEGIIVKENQLVPDSFDEEATEFKGGTRRKKESEIYHRAPRNYEKLSNDIIEIEAPPVKQEAKSQSLFMALGPSITMALPMILGCVLMAYASGGSNSGLYMYSGLIMSVSSALVGVMWGLINIRNEKKSAKEREERRFKAYSAYLVEKSETVKEKYNDTIRRLQETYPDVNICLGYSDKQGALWGRNHTHDDFLSHRLGIGKLPFQCRIEVPKKQFSLDKDDLSLKPAFIKANYEKLIDVPVTVDLLKNTLIGIVGDDNKKNAIEVAKVLSGQIAANNCYTDVKLAYIFNNDSSEDFGNWDFAKWFPHVWSEDKQSRFVAENENDRSEVFYELSKIFRTRSEAESGDKERKIKKPYYIVFVSDIKLLEGEMFAKYAFEDNDKFGLTTIILAKSAEELPNECEFIIENTSSFKGMYNIYEGKNERQEIKFDHINKDITEFSRRLLQLHVPEMEEGGEIPNSITFFEMNNINKIEDYPVVEYWAKSRTYENIRGMLGFKSGGAPCYLDVHEKYHGPHGLVAGTTGSGKSETLQTYILSLAINYSPDDIGFFIIDYKGGGMANLFEGLPHMIGQISNLSGNQVKRAMVSIKSENKRRQRIFTENGVNNINLYTKLYKNGEARVPVPHLFIIIDEFAELKREEPDFMRELISVAQVGRSLGVHLILATQKPSGTVDDNIWSNSKFRICLRVQDQADSKDMLHRTDAAYITQAGRGYLQVGNDELFELFQSGFSGAVYDENMIASTKEIAKLITLPGKVDMTGNTVKLSQKRRSEEKWISKLLEAVRRILEKYNLTVSNINVVEDSINQLVVSMYKALENMGEDYPESTFNTARLKDFIMLVFDDSKNGQVISAESLPGIVTIVNKAQQYGVKLPQAKEKTQLDVTKEYLAKVALENGYTYKQQLWMPLLGEKIYLDSFKEYKQFVYKDGKWETGYEEWNLEIVIGLFDDPANQNQMALTFDFAKEGHLGIIGSIVSGKSTMMQTIIYGLINKFTPEYVNIYALDFSSKALQAFEDAPHIGGIMCDDDIDSISKFFNMINKIVEYRKKLFRGANYKQYVQVNGVVLPSIFIFVDNYGAFKEKAGEIYDEQMITLSKEGISLGIFLIVSGSTVSYMDISSRLIENFETSVALSMQDKSGYADVLHTMNFDVMPESGIKGRGLAFYGNSILEYQTALCLEADNDYERLDKIKELCKDMSNNWKGKCARKIPVIPEKPVWIDFEKLDEYETALDSKELIPVGYNQDNAEIYSINMIDFFCYMIYGRQKSGKTNFIKATLNSVLNKNIKCAIIDSDRAELSRYENSPNVTYMNDEKVITGFVRNELSQLFVERKPILQEFIDKDLERDEIFVQMNQKCEPYFVFITDMAWFLEVAYNIDNNLGGRLENLISKGDMYNIYFVSEINTLKVRECMGYQLFNICTEYRTGINIGGETVNNDWLDFDYVDYKEAAQKSAMGVAQVPGYGDYSQVKNIVVPFVRNKPIA